MVSYSNHFCSFAKIVPLNAQIVPQNNHNHRKIIITSHSTIPEVSTIFSLSGNSSNSLKAMAKTGITALTIALMAGMWTVTMEQSSSSCTSVLISLSPCLNYITGNSSTPSSGCCSQLASVVASQPKCLCEAISGDAASSLGISINRTVALGLPSACSVQTPPLSRCNGG